MALWPKMNLRYSLRMELAISIMLIALLPGIIGASLAYVSAEKNTMRQLDHLMTGTIALKHQAVSYWVERKENALTILAQNTRLLYVLQSKLPLAMPDFGLSQELKDQVRLGKEWRSLSLVNMEGRVLLSSDPEKVGAQMEVARSAPGGAREFQVQVTQLEDHPAVLMSYPIVGGQQEELGWMLAEPEMSQLNSIMNLAEKLGGSADSFILSGDGVLVTQPRKQHTDDFWQVTQQCNPESEPVYEHINTNGELIYVSHEWMPRYRLCVVAEISAEEAFMEFSRFQQTVLLFLLGMMVFVLAMALLISNRLVSPISELVQLTRRLADGNFEDSMMQPSRFFEVQTLSRAFNDMANSLETYNRFLEERVEQRTQELMEKNDQLEQTMQELETERKKQLQQAYNAGMAENAISVLHNIGNAITPMVIRLQNYRNQHKKTSSSNYLLKLKDLLEQQLTAGNMDQFFREDARGKQIPQFMSQLAQQDTQSNQVLADILNYMDHQLRHITEIIALQQKYAHMQGVEERYAIESVIADALEMMQPAFEKRGVRSEVHNDGGNTSVRNDPNKMAQLLMNLFKNSLEALDERIRDEPGFKGSIEVRIHEEDNQVQVEIQDNGRGASPDALERAFEFGFSTKQRGSGFGLHDCANFIRTQGGEIRLESPGLGEGATITFTLPSIHRTPEA